MLNYNGNTEEEKRLQQEQNSLNSGTSSFGQATIPDQQEPTPTQTTQNASEYFNNMFSNDEDLQLRDTQEQEQGQEQEQHKPHLDSVSMPVPDSDEVLGLVDSPNQHLSTLNQQADSAVEYFQRQQQSLSERKAARLGQTRKKKYDYLGYTPSGIDKYDLSETKVDYSPDARNESMHNKVMNNMNFEENMFMVKRYLEEFPIESDGQGGFVQRQADGTYAPIDEGELSTLYGYRTKDGGYKYGTAAGTGDPAVTRFGEDVLASYREEAARKGQGSMAFIGEKGVDINQPLLRVVLPSRVSALMEGLIHGSTVNMKDRAVTDREGMSKYEYIEKLKEYGSGATEVYHFGDRQESLLTRDIEEEWQHLKEKYNLANGARRTHDEVLQERLDAVAQSYQVFEEARKQRERDNMGVAGRAWNVAKAVPAVAAGSIADTGMLAYRAFSSKSAEELDEQSLKIRDAINNFVGYDAYFTRKTVEENRAVVAEMQKKYEETGEIDYMAALGVVWNYFTTPESAGESLGAILPWMLRIPTGATRVGKALKEAEALMKTAKTAEDVKAAKDKVKAIKQAHSALDNFKHFAGQNVGSAIDIASRMENYGITRRQQPGYDPDNDTVFDSVVGLSMAVASHALDRIALGSILKDVPGIKNVLNKGAAKALKDAAEIPEVAKTLRGKAINAGKGLVGVAGLMAKGAGTNVVIESMQSVLDSIAVLGGTEGYDYDFNKLIFTTDAAFKAFDFAASGAAVGAHLSAFNSIVSSVHRAKSTKEAVVEEIEAQNPELGVKPEYLDELQAENKELVDRINETGITSEGGVLSDINNLPQLVSNVTSYKSNLNTLLRNDKIDRKYYDERMGLIKRIETRVINHLEELTPDQREALFGIKSASARVLREEVENGQDEVVTTSEAREERTFSRLLSSLDNIKIYDEGTQQDTLETLSDRLIEDILDTTVNWKEKQITYRLELGIGNTGKTEEKVFTETWSQLLGGTNYDLNKIDDVVRARLNPKAPSAAESVNTADTVSEDTVLGSNAPRAEQTSTADPIVQKRERLHALYRAAYERWSDESGELTDVAKKEILKNLEDISQNQLQKHDVERIQKYVKDMKTATEVLYESTVGPRGAITYTFEAESLASAIQSDNKHIRDNALSKAVSLYMQMVSFKDKTESSREELARGIEAANQKARDMNYQESVSAPSDTNPLNEKYVTDYIKQDGNKYTISFTRENGKIEADVAHAQKLVAHKLTTEETLVKGIKALTGLATFKDTGVSLKLFGDEASSKEVPVRTDKTSKTIDAFNAWDGESTLVSNTENQSKKSATKLITNSFPESDWGDKGIVRQTLTKAATTGAYSTEDVVLLHLGKGTNNTGKGYADLHTTDPSKGDDFTKNLKSAMRVQATIIIDDLGENKNQAAINDVTGFLTSNNYVELGDTGVFVHTAVKGNRSKITKFNSMWEGSYDYTKSSNFQALEKAYIKHKLAEANLKKDPNNAALLEESEQAKSSYESLLEKEVGLRSGITQIKSSENATIESIEGDLSKSTKEKINAYRTGAVADDDIVSLSLVAGEDLNTKQENVRIFLDYWADIAKKITSPKQLEKMLKKKDEGLGLGLFKEGRIVVGDSILDVKELLNTKGTKKVVHRYVSKGNNKPTKVSADPSKYTEIQKPTVLNTIPFDSLPSELQDIAKEISEALRGLEGIPEGPPITSGGFALGESPSRGLIWSEPGVIKGNTAAAIGLVLYEYLSNNRFSINSASNKSDAEVAKIFGVAEADVTDAMRAEVSELGTLYKTAAHILGTQIAAALGIKAKKNSPTGAYESLVADLGAAAIHVAEKRGLITITNKKSSELERVFKKGKHRNQNAADFAAEGTHTNFITTTPETEKEYDRITRTSRELDKMLPDATQSGRLPITGVVLTEEQIKENPDVQRRTTTVLNDAGIGLEPPKEAQTTLLKMMSTPYHLITGTGEILKDWTKDAVKNMKLKQRLGFMTEEEIENSNILKADRDSAREKNKQIEADLHHLMDYVNGVDVDNADSNTLYFKYGYGLEGRYYLHSRTVNPQGSKLHKGVIVPKEHTVELVVDKNAGTFNYIKDGKPYQIGHQVRVGLAQAMGISIDSTPTDEALGLGSKLLSIPKEDLGTVLNEYLHTGQFTVTHNNTKTVFTPKHVSEFLKAYQFLVEYNNTEDGGNMSGTLNIDYDVKTSAHGTRVVQYGLGSDQIEAKLNQLGYFTEAGVSPNDVYSSRTFDDVYQSTAKKVESELEAAVERITKDNNKGLRADFKADLKALYDSFITDKKSSRDLIKKLFIPFSFSASISSVRKEASEYFAMFILNSILNRGEVDYSNPLYKALDNLKTKVYIQDKQGNKIQFNSVDDLAESLKTRELFEHKVDSVHTDNLNTFTQMSLGDYLIGVYANPYIGKAVQDVFNSEFKDVNKVQKVTNKLFELAYQSFNRAFNSRIKELQKQDVMITEEVIREEVQNLLETNFPGIEGPLSEKGVLDGLAMIRQGQSGSEYSNRNSPQFKFVGEDGKETSRKTNPILPSIAPSDKAGAPRSVLSLDGAQMTGLFNYYIENLVGGASEGVGIVPFHDGVTMGVHIGDAGVYGYNAELVKKTNSYDLVAKLEGLYNRLKETDLISSEEFVRLEKDIQEMRQTKDKFVQEFNSRTFYVAPLGGMAGGVVKVVNGDVVEAATGLEANNDTDNTQYGRYDGLRVETTRGREITQSEIADVMEAEQTPVSEADAAFIPEEDTLGYQEQHYPDVEFSDTQEITPELQAAIDRSEQARIEANRRSQEYRDEQEALQAEQYAAQQRSKEETRNEAKNRATQKQNQLEEERLAEWSNAEKYDNQTEQDVNNYLTGEFIDPVKEEAEKSRVKAVLEKQATKRESNDPLSLLDKTEYIRENVSNITLSDVADTLTIGGEDFLYLKTREDIMNSDTTRQPIIIVNPTLSSIAESELIVDSNTARQNIKYLNDKQVPGKLGEVVEWGTNKVSSVSSIRKEDAALISGLLVKAAIETGVRDEELIKTINNVVESLLGSAGYKLSIVEDGTSVKDVSILIDRIVEDYSTADLPTLSIQFGDRVSVHKKVSDDINVHQANFTRRSLLGEAEKGAINTIDSIFNSLTRSSEDLTKGCEL